jgi:CMP-N-acetylneuraminic acid synthetase
VRLLNGHPLVSWSVATAVALKRLGHVNDIVVVTDSEEYAAVARSYGARCPVLRPESVSGLLSGDHEWFEWFATWQREHEPDLAPEYVVHLRATSPVTDAGEVLSCLRHYLPLGRDYDSLRTVTLYEGQSPYKFYNVDCQPGGERSLRPLYPRVGSTEEVYNAARQKLPAVYVDNGRVNIIKVSAALAQRSISGSRMLAHVTAGTHTDIDDEHEFVRAEKEVLQRCTSMPCRLHPDALE